MSLYDHLEAYPVCIYMSTKGVLGVLGPAGHKQERPEGLLAPPLAIILLCWTYADCSAVPCCTLLNSPVLNDQLHPLCGTSISSITTTSISPITIGYYSWHRCCHVDLQAKLTNMHGTSVSTPPYILILHTRNQMNPNRNYFPGLMCTLLLCFSSQ